jgi:predicted nucleic acid-binding protein
LTDCLDSWAVLRWLEGKEPAAGRVEHSREVINELRQRLRLDVPNEARVLEAAAIKARHTLAYADAFAVATALAHRASLLTGDPEILDDGDPTWPTIDLRS